MKVKIKSNQRINNTKIYHQILQMKEQAVTMTKKQTLIYAIK
jgi:hypothetical protein